ncbi:MAG: class C sortase [Clostridia bacterium]|jgi:sortase A|nr:class C sortase [Clostridia bacterium]
MKSKPKKSKSKSKSSSLKTSILFILILLVGLSLLLYPSVSNYWNSLHSSRAISSYQEAVSKIDQEKIDAMLAEAKAYNKKLFDEGYTLILPEPRKESYFKLLDVTGTGIMGYIEIKKLGVYLPIYHGTSDSVLQNAVGHIEGSFLPVGGVNTHTVLSGHRGLPSAKLFTDLDKMLVGDTFSLRILNDVLTYEVDQILTVLPQELDALDVVPGEDLCTLITCTPYGINTHRLLVRGHRIETPEDARTIRVPGDALRVNTAVVSVFLAAPVLLALFVLVLLRTPGNKKKKPKQKKENTKIQEDKKETEGKE